MESLSSVMKVRPQKPDHHQELKVTSSTKKVTNNETKKNSEVSKIADLRMTHLDGVYRSCSYFVATLLLRTRKQLMIHI